MEDVEPPPCFLPLPLAKYQDEHYACGQQGE
jgi:hypothetical protein